MQAMAEYRRAKAALKRRWQQVSQLRGVERSAAVSAYTAEKARVRTMYDEMRGLARGLSREDSGGPPTEPVEPGALGLALEVTEAFASGALDLSARADAPAPGWDGMPECLVAARMLDGGSQASDVRLLLTFASAMDRARDADRLWFAAEKLWRAESWAFDPEEIVRRSLTAMADVLRTCGVTQRHRVDSAAWRTIAESLVEEAAPEIRTAVFEGRGDATELLSALQRTTPAGTDRFPMLRGPKIGPMWVRMLAVPGGASISSLDQLPVAVDVQVRKVTEYLAMTDTGPLALEEARPVIQAAWATDVQEAGAVGPAPIDGTPAALDPALWFWGKWGCTRCERAAKKLPISPVCGRCRFPHRRAT
jgi:hypothetical protein